MSYTVTYTLGTDGWWTAKVRKVPGCHTQGRTIAAARRRIREALALFEDDADRAELVDHVILPTSVRIVLRKVIAGREKARKAESLASDATRMAVRVLVKRVGLSTRDAAELVGLSHQRVQQLARSGR